ncbi:NAD(P)/FAD-dependent oxidoreductase [Paenibacillus endoradicis]|uniref:NAD(P)/FAD-dependent oxidoreductase n=1 Tax=Paenibacillus endoradicis TaxID=2972487 RepID=UPI0021591D93|nr:NAD(P)/FAD-dependent oxidoreductase [Paenibacillus endoradicis]MCR8658878.1 NAD(P)/FAD-dependent oxidoreductase [Paenibacillus endoradicis]
MICAIIGGGPAGLNAALLLARSRHKVYLFDNAKPRNAVTEAMHGFITREGISPLKFRKLAQQELEQFKHVKQYQSTITEIKRSNNGTFTITTSSGKKLQVNKVLLATGLQESLPSIRNISRYYGRSVFSCPYCDGYELRDRALAVFTEASNVVSLAATLQQWSKRIFVFTNGKYKLTNSEKELLKAMDIAIYEQPIVQLVGQKGQLQGILLKDGSKVNCTGGFVSTYWRHAGTLASELGCRLTDQGGIWQDGKGRTSVQGVYVAGDMAHISPAQAVIAAGDGVKAAISMNQDAAQQRLTKIQNMIRKQ